MSWLPFWNRGGSAPDGLQGMLEVDKALDISEVYSRLLIVGMPYKGLTSRTAHRNNADELAAHLALTYGAKNYVVWNLTTEDRCNVDERKFREQVLKFPPVLSDADVPQLDDGLPQIHEIFHICYALKFWLDLSPSHVAVLHEDKGRTRAPFLAACFLAWAHNNEFHDPVEALSRVSEHRDVLKTFPCTWYRTLLAWNQMCISPTPVPARPLRLHTIIVSMSGAIKAHKAGVRLQVFVGRRLAWDSDADSDRYGAGRSVADDESGSSSGAITGSDYQYDEGLLKVRVDEDVVGDVLILVSVEVDYNVPMQVVPTPTGELPDMTPVEGFFERRTIRRTLVRYAFHTNTLPADAIQVPMDHCDLPKANRKWVLANPAGDPATPGRSRSSDFWMQLVLGEAGGGGKADDHSAAPEALVAPARPAAPSTSTAVSADDLQGMTSEHSYVKYRDWLNLTGRAAQLAGLFWFVDAHHVMSEASLVHVLCAEFSLPHSHFAQAAIAMAQRDMDVARAILRSDLMQTLMRPRVVLPSAVAGSRRASVLGLLEEQGVSSSEVIIPVIATTLAAMLAVGQDAAAGKASKGTEAAHVSLQEQHERISAFLHSGLAHMLIDEEGEGEEEREEGEGGGARGGEDDVHDHRPRREAPHVRRHSGFGGAGELGSGRRGAVTPEHPSPGDAPPAQLKMRDLLGIEPRIALLAAGRGDATAPGGGKRESPQAPTQSGRGPAFRYPAPAAADFTSPGGRVGAVPAAVHAEGVASIDEVLGSLYSAPDPSLYLAGLQLAAAVQTAERRAVELGSASRSREGRGLPFHADVSWLSALEPEVLKQVLASLQALNATSMPGGNAPAGWQSVPSTMPSAVAAVPGAYGSGWLPLGLGSVVTGVTDLVGGMLGGAKAVVDKPTHAHAAASYGAAYGGEEDDMTQVKRAAAVRQLAGLLEAQPQLGALFALMGPELSGRGSGRRSVGGSGSGSGSSLPLLSPLRLALDLSAPLSEARQHAGSVERREGGRSPGLRPPFPVSSSSSPPASSAAEGSAGSSSAATAPAPPPPSIDAPELSKYVRMLKMGIPPGAVEAKMGQEGCKLDAIAVVLGSVGAVPITKPPAAAAPASAEEEEEEEEEEPPAPTGAARVVALRAEQAAAAAVGKLPLSQHPVWGQYFKMLRMGLPLPVVQNKLGVAGLDPAILGCDPAEAHPTPPPSLREDPATGKYFKMLKMGLPVGAVAHKVSGEGLDPILLELDPDLPLPASLPGGRAEVAEKAKAAPKVVVKEPPKPKRLRKKLHWDALPADRMRGGVTIWSSTDAAGAGMEEEGDIFDDEELEALFTQSTGPGGIALPLQPKAGAGGTGIVSLLDMKRGRSVAIGLAKLRLPAPALRAVLLNLSIALDTSLLPPGHAAIGTSLSTEQLLVLEDLLPSPEEITLVRAYRGDKSRLGEAETFFLAIADVGKAKARAGALVFQQSFGGRVAETDSRVKLLTAACAEVRRSKRLKRVLESVLKLGNKLNLDEEGDGGGRAAAGFTLASLLKLSTTKSFNGKTTLLQYLASALARKDGTSSLDLASELPSSGPASRVDVARLREDVNGLRVDLGGVERLVREHARTTGGDGAGGMSSPGGMTSPVAASGASTVIVLPVLAAPAPSSPSSSSSGPGSSSAGGDGSAEAVAAAASAESEQALAEAAADDTLQSFVARAQARLAALTSRSEAAATEFAGLLNFFGEEKSTSVESFFATLSSFVRMLAKAAVDIAEAEARAVREGRAAEREKARLEVKQEKVREGAAAAAAAAKEEGTVAPAHAHSLSTPAPYRGPAMLAQPEVAEGAESPDPRAKLEALFKSKSAFFLRTGGLAVNPASGSPRGAAGRQSTVAPPAVPPFQPLLTVAEAAASNAAESEAPVQASAVAHTPSPEVPAEAIAPEPEAVRPPDVPTAEASAPEAGGEGQPDAVDVPAAATIEVQAEAPTSAASDEPATLPTDAGGSAGEAQPAPAPANAPSAAVELPTVDEQPALPSAEDTALPSVEEPSEEGPAEVGASADSPAGEGRGAGKGKGKKGRKRR